MDGWMVRCRGDRWGEEEDLLQDERVEWKECKAAAIFWPSGVAEVKKGRRTLVTKHVVAMPADTDPVAFGRRVHEEAKRMGLGRAAKTYVIMAGQPHAPKPSDLAGGRCRMRTGQNRRPGAAGGGAPRGIVLRGPPGAHGLSGGAGGGGASVAARWSRSARRTRTGSSGGGGSSSRKRASRRSSSCTCGIPTANRPKVGLTPSSRREANGSAHSGDAPFAFNLKTAVQVSPRTHMRA